MHVRDIIVVLVSKCCHFMGRITLYYFVRKTVSYQIKFNLHIAELTENHVLIEQKTSG